MSRIEVAELEEAERTSVLGTGGTGVLSFSTEGDEPPRTVPVSYGYDSVESTFYFRLATSPEHPPETLDGHAVSFVTYDANDEWWSVVAKGRLQDIERDDVGTDALEGLERVEIPLIDIFETHPREIDFAFCRLEPTAFTGRRESSTAP
ncbi:pyridoxamine 5'-phosphate oxidase family protein [Natronosalvus halobius]|uniref:pyridoxamine 5'-phosphate oxidase family protein n=1 Tax=Natronosalvus halobius TaxID=2953746 RepID=UPI0020A1C846|nr:pyridoxamine 5'-phosphate oxidase family protein [Natronosalvus halobius]USZ70287.1 pyridoxamine 5'-phosphate oxidase family protein [Natronosalvus halobius]